MSTPTYSNTRAVLALSISLLLTTFVYAPFAGAARPNARPNTSRRVHQQSVPPYREREVLVRFRAGVAPDVLGRERG